MSLDTLYNALPIVRELRAMRNALWAHGSVTEAALAHLRQVRIALRLAEPRFADHRSLNRFEHQVFSQNGEDGIIAEILRRIGVDRSGLFVEIGVGTGLENNTGYLLAQGWKGIWIEGDTRHVSQIRRALDPLIKTKALTVVEAFVTRENVLEHVRSARQPDDIDVLSIDVDQNTFWIWDGLRALSPKVVVVEYNATWPAAVDWAIKYDPQARWDGSFAFGASLAAFARLGKELQYCLVACDLAGINAFFVRSDLVGDRFVGPFDAATHYQPPDYLLIPSQGMPRGFAAYFGQLGQ